MPDLSSIYMGLKLKNPIIVASCSLVKSVDNVRKCEEQNAGAVVLKSLFEEQINVEAKRTFDHSDAAWHPESYDYIRNNQMEFSESQYLEFVKNSKRAVSIPIIASVNCSSAKGWIEYAKKLEDAGADALELNIAVMANDSKITGNEIEKHYLEIVDRVKELISIPLAIKIGPYFSSPARMAMDLSWHGASALVLFNRFYQFDIDTEKLAVTAGNRFSATAETCLTLRWIALLAGRIKCSLAASTGVHTGQELIKHLLAGADAVQVCSTLYLNGLGQINVMLKELSDWMEDHDFDSIDIFHGMLSQRKSETPESYERLQYIKALVGIE